MSMNDNGQGEDDDHQAVLISQLYSGLYTHQMIPQQEYCRKEIIKRRRKKKKKSNKKLGGDVEMEKENKMSSGVVGIMKKRKLSAEQVELLESSFGNEHKLESERKDRLAIELGLDPRQVAVWFQNRRARWKNNKLQQEYTNLKKLHDSVILEKCRLETQILKLKEQLSEAEKEKERLMIMRERVDGPLSNSPSPSLSMELEAMEPNSNCLGEFGVIEGYDDVFYMPHDTCTIHHGMEWLIPYM